MSRDTPTPPVVHIRYTKWNDSLHWHFDAEVARRDEHGIWVVVPPGGSYRRGTETPRIDDHGFVVLISDGGWWTAYFNAVPHGPTGQLIYVDINTAAIWEGNTAHLVDLDLDVVLQADGTVRIIDEDEFDDHRTRWDYPRHVVDRTRATAAQIATQIELGTEPFGVAGITTVAEHLGWAHGTVVSGHGVASGAADDPRFPRGTIAAQLPYFAEHGLPTAGLFQGTINVDLPFRFESREPRLRVRDLVWTPGYPAETFEFFDAKLVLGATLSDVFIYRPHPDTKPEFHQADGIVEILGPKLHSVEPGTPASVWIDPAQGSFLVG